MALEVHAIPAYIEADHHLHTVEAIFLNEGPFVKLEPLWQYCRTWNIRAYYFDDFVIPYDLLWRILKQKDSFITQCMNCKPFGTEANQEMLEFFRFVERARERGDNLMAWCD